MLSEASPLLLQMQSWGRVFLQNYSIVLARSPVAFPAVSAYNAYLLSACSALCILTYAEAACLRRFGLQDGQHSGGGGPFC